MLAGRGRYDVDDAISLIGQQPLHRCKIALERETQAALDPEVGAAEVRAMQREIHRMRLRYAQLKKRQETMITDMERAIYKRDNIESKGKTMASKKGAPPTGADGSPQAVEGGCGRSFVIPEVRHGPHSLPGVWNHSHGTGGGRTIETCRKSTL